jgi:hypothetical protein
MEDPFWQQIHAEFFGEIVKLLNPKNLPHVNPNAFLYVNDHGAALLFCDGEKYYKRYNIENFLPKQKSI